MPVISKNSVCSFCGRRQDEVDRLFIGKDACICNECVNVCFDLLTGRAASKHTKVTKQQEKSGFSALPRPIDL